MPMMRRRPSGVSPKSRTGSRVTFIFIRGESSIKRKFPQNPEQFPLCSRRLGAGDLLARVADQRAQGLQVGPWMLARERGERQVVADQALAPGLQALLARARLRRLPGDPGERCAHRLRVHLAHDLADVLQLAAPRLVAGDAL